jgi:membrane protein YdbS with pleckstrin-like domain
VRLVVAVVVVWLLIGVVAVFQRGYLGSSSNSCAHVGTVAVTVVAGPLNYAGVNPKVNCDVDVPQPSR